MRRTRATAIERSRSGRDLLVSVSRAAPGTLQDQLSAQLREAIRRGALRPGAALPSSRALAADLDVSRGVVVEVYAQLAAEGYVRARDRAVPRVAAGAGQTASSLPERDHPDPPAKVRHDLRPGVPDLAAFPRTAWAGGLRRAVREVSDRELGYPEPAGPPALRAALAEYLGRVRGVVADAEDVVICAGVAQGLGLLGRALRRTGVRRLAVEDPAHADERRVVAATGLEIVPVPVDAEGLSVEALKASGAEAVLVTPAHQFPTGVVLAPDRRAALLAWAARTGGLIVEDDYDAEFRYDRAPVGSLQGLLPDRVVYTGSVSKTLAPALRLGWLIVPAPLREVVRDEKALADLGSPTLDCLALAHLLTTGTYDRHLRRCRARYGRRRQHLLAELAERLPGMVAGGVSAGLHLTTRLPDGIEEHAAVEAAAARGVAVGALEPHLIAASWPPTLLLGYAGVPEAVHRTAVRALATALRAA